MAETRADRQALFRLIPKADTLLSEERVQMLLTQYGKDCVMDAMHGALDQIRDRIAAGEGEEEIRAACADLIAEMEGRLCALHTPKVMRVINGSGTILHTNLGRAPLSQDIAKEAADRMSGYLNLEYDVRKGARGERYAHFASLLCRLTGAEDAMAVNNNAGAVLLVLSALASGGDVIVSRGELVEIGGKFRIPDICALSGCTLHEIGTTNKTHLSDYTEAFSEETKAVLKVHRSNFRIVGFAESVPAKEIAPFTKERDLPLIEDLGSGLMVDAASLGIKGERSVQEALADGADIVCFSGDKLLGGPQAGIIAGKKCYIERIKKHPLTRALRIDKFTVCALEATLLRYLNPEKAKTSVPVLKMISEDKESVRIRANRLLELIRPFCKEVKAQLEDVNSTVGGGAVPGLQIASVAVALTPGEKMHASLLHDAFLAAKVPVITRIEEEKLFLDARTLADDDLPVIADALGEILSADQTP